VWNACALLLAQKLLRISRPDASAHTWNPSYSGGWDLEDRGSRPAWANSSQYPISKISRAKQTGGVVEVVEHLLCKNEALSSNPSCAERKRTEEFQEGHGKTNTTRHSPPVIQWRKCSDGSATTFFPGAGVRFWKPRLSEPRFTHPHHDKPSSSLALLWWVLNVSGLRIPLYNMLFYRQRGPRYPSWNREARKPFGELNGGVFQNVSRRSKLGCTLSHLQPDTLCLALGFY
jgi:hypothetical protein